jgi:RimJ/RimL family protein N-acetyltransferase
MTPLSIPTIETERLILRGWQESDVAMVAELYADETNARYIGGTKTHDQCWRAVATFIGHWQLRGYGLWCVTRKDSGTAIGWAGLWFPDGWPEPELGYALHGDHHGQGFASEATRAALTSAYRDFGWATAISLIDPGNTASQNVTRKLGGTLEAANVRVLEHVGDIWRHQNAETFLKGAA